MFSSKRHKWKLRLLNDPMIFIIQIWRQPFNTQVHRTDYRNMSVSCSSGRLHLWPSTPSEWIDCRDAFRQAVPLNNSEIIWQTYMYNQYLMNNHSHVKEIPNNHPYPLSLFPSLSIYLYPFSSKGILSDFHNALSRAFEEPWTNKTARIFPLEM